MGQACRHRELRRPDNHHSDLAVILGVVLFMEGGGVGRRLSRAFPLEMRVKQKKKKCCSSKPEDCEKNFWFT